MTLEHRRSFLLFAGAGIVAAALPLLASAQAAAPKNRALFSVTENDPARWNLVLNNARAIREGVGSEGIEIEIVAYGPGVAMLKDESSVKQRIAETMKAGVKVNACQNTMNSMKLSPSDMLPEIGYVPSGVVEVMRKQQQGWAYIRS
ncbi:MAG: DsrE family protein [Pseudomonadota bacterium]|nr:DsrE family protein [Pseudomonadota bacterium]